MSLGFGNAVSAEPLGFVPFGVVAIGNDVGPAPAGVSTCAWAAARLPAESLTSTRTKIGHFTPLGTNVVRPPHAPSAVGVDGGAATDCQFGPESIP